MCGTSNIYFLLYPDCKLRTCGSVSTKGAPSVYRCWYSYCRITVSLAIHDISCLVSQYWIAEGGDKLAEAEISVLLQYDDTIRTAATVIAEIVIMILVIRSSSGRSSGGHAVCTISAVHDWSFFARCITYFDRQIAWMSWQWMAVAMHL